MVNEQAFESVCDTARRAARYHSAADALEWDERTRMPLAAGEYRGEQIAELRAAAHRLRTGDGYGQQLTELSGQLDDSDPSGDRSATIRLLHRDWSRDRKLPVELVSAISVATTRGQQTWDAARKADSFEMFRDVLSEIIRLKQDAGARLAEGTDATAYDALLDEYEPGAKTAELNPVLSALKDRLTNLIRTLREAPRQPDVEILQRDYDVDAQREFSQRIAAAIGFDFERGRLDETSHPFCTTLGPNDCRILTRFDTNWFPGGLYGTMHEAGHGMYEQGLRGEWFGLPPGSYTSLGIHESQSRLWENQVGRSEAFVKWLFPQVAASFPTATEGVSLEAFYFAINRVHPSLIRVEADEATYNLHIIIRYELEQQLIDGTLSVDDLPGAWNEQYDASLGIRPPSDADGVLQDVHWSAGLFGYFPTYTLGNVAGAQLFAAAEKSIGDLGVQFAAGEFEPLLLWLRENVHTHGRCYSGNELVEKVTGEAVSSTHLISYLEQKLFPLYGV